LLDGAEPMITHGTPGRILQQGALRGRGIGRRFLDPGKLLAPLPGGDTIANTGELAELRAVSNPSPHRVQVDISHASEDRALVGEALALEPAFPETSGAFVLGVGAPRDVLVEAAHEPAEAAEAFPAEREAIRIREQSVEVGFGGWDRVACVIPIFGEETAPSPGDVVIAPLGGAKRVGAQYNVKVVGHHGVGENLDGKKLDQGLDTVPNPFPAMLVVALGVRVVSAEECAPDAPRDAVIDAGLIREENVLSSRCHGQGYEQSNTHRVNAYFC
jgi:hypothetical protein